MNRFWATSLLLLACFRVESATIVEIREQESTVSWAEISGQQVRMTGLEAPYVLVDTLKGQFVAVFPPVRQALDISIDVSLDPATDTLSSPRRLDLQRRGTTELIAGYPAERYGVVANGRLCAEVWLSREALEIRGMRQYLRALRLFSAQQRAFLAQHGMPSEPCDDARHAATKRYPSMGLPLRIRDSGGKTLQEIVAIETNVNLDAARYRIPSDYEMLDAEDLR